MAYIMPRMKEWINPDYLQEEMKRLDDMKKKQGGSGRK